MMIGYKTTLDDGFERAVVVYACQNVQSIFEEERMFEFYWMIILRMYYEKMNFESTCNLPKNVRPYHMIDMSSLLDNIKIECWSLIVQTVQRATQCINFKSQRLIRVMISRHKFMRVA